MSLAHTEPQQVERVEDIGAERRAAAQPDIATTIVPSAGIPPAGSRWCDLPAAATATATEASAAAVVSLASRPGFVHPQGTAPEIPTVHRGRRIRRVLLRDIDKAEPLPLDDSNCLHGPEIGEQLAQTMVSRGRALVLSSPAVEGQRFQHSSVHIERRISYSADGSLSSNRDRV